MHFKLNKFDLIQFEKQITNRKATFFSVKSSFKGRSSPTRQMVKALRLKEHINIQSGIN